jgi:hypothetical protein
MVAIVGTMNFRHAAALALVGWYLLTPPSSAEGKFKENAPLTNWLHNGSYDSAASCEAVHRKLNRAPVLGVTADEQNHVRMSFMLSRCISTDDPRLKEK